MSSAANTGDVKVRHHSKFHWALADGFVLAKRNLVQIPRKIGRASCRERVRHYV